MGPIAAIGVLWYCAIHWISLVILRGFSLLLRRLKIISHYFPNFTLNGQLLQFVDEFRYLGHYIKDNTKFVIPYLFTLGNHNHSPHSESDAI